MGKCDSTYGVATPLLWENVIHFGVATPLLWENVIRLMVWLLQFYGKM
jgi:hypothetical protein